MTMEGTQQGSQPCLCRSDPSLHLGNKVASGRYQPPSAVVAMMRKDLGLMLAAAAREASCIR
jgi:hypothetical protein